MSSGANVLFDDLGPRGRRQIRIASIISGIVLAGAIGVALKRLNDNGQFAAALWEPFLDRALWRFLWGGLQNTLAVAAVAMVLALVVGGLMALGRLARNRPLRWFAGIYVEFFRAVPLLLLILFSYLAVRPVLLERGIELSAFWYLVMGLVLYNSAMLAEIFRAGILSLDRGQSEAAYSLGMSYWQSMLFVVIPQAGRRMVPAILSQLVALLKDSALGYIIAYEELLREAGRAGIFFGNVLQMYVVVALMYFSVNYALSKAAQRLEVRQRRRYKAAPIEIAGGSEDVAVTSEAGR